MPASTREKCLSDLAQLKRPNRHHIADEAALLRGVSKHDLMWLHKKTDRQRRLSEQYEWLAKFAPRLIMKAEPRTHVDIGPGPGEMLELSRWHGHRSVGVDAESGDGGMGHLYLEYSKVQTSRQRLSVHYRGFVPWLNEQVDRAEYRLTVNNWTSRGSIEQAFAKWMEGEPHHRHQDCKQLRWKETGETRSMIASVLARMAILSQNNAQFAIHANGAANTEWWDETIQATAIETGWRLMWSAGQTQHVFQLCR